VRVDVRDRELRGSRNQSGALSGAADQRRRHAMRPPYRASPPPGPGAERRVPRARTPAPA
jgi:hypothetical protein